MESYVGEIRMFAGNFAPQGWQWCDGRLIRIDEHEVLFSLIGTTYGGDGMSTFGLPDLRGRLPLHRDPDRFVMGQSGGMETVTLTQNQLPSHSHNLHAAAEAGVSADPAGKLLAVPADMDLYNTAAAQTPLHAGLVQAAGGNGVHSNMQPYLSIGFIIALYGVWPPQA